MLPVAQSLAPWQQVLLLVVPSISAVIAAAALVLSTLQTRRQNKLSRASMVAACLDGFLKDEDIQAAFDEIEYGTFSYGAEFHGSEVEQRVDKLLRHFANLSLAWKSGLLTARDIAPISYYIRRTVDNDELQKYLSFLAGWSREAGIGSHPYASLDELNRVLVVAAKRPNNCLQATRSKQRAPEA